MIRAKRRFGQNFLINSATIEQIVAALQADAADRVIEIGPGLGALTTLIQPLVQHLDLIEIDRNLIPILSKKFNTDKITNVSIHNTDALKIVPQDYLDPHSKQVKIIGNLPYNVATQIICNLMAHANAIHSMIFMVQKEVADRITANPNNKHYGRLTVAVQYFCKAEHLFDVPPTDFEPQPKITSSIICLTPYHTLPCVVDNYAMLQSIVTAAFNQRRKVISNSLKKHFDLQQLRACGIEPTQRPEQLTITQFVRLANSSKLLPEGS
ncbi:MAG: 16S rRNA (adenine(1518)-N(6)/adenine(1519)-N(6))-dimethyltransferase [Thiotrichales bacterium]|nr:MAG: 16S rRNA (adenine(1518)-N(6)/adenine(1519)-N(6))-dimethyltransferase [Thiotrichales bacterium]